MAVDLKVTVRKEIDRLKQALGAARGRVAALRDEIKKHEQIYDMLDAEKIGKRAPRDRSAVKGLRRGPRGAMIDWNAVFAALPDQFTLDTMVAHETANEKSRGYLRQVVVRWTKEGRIKRTARGAYEKVQTK